MLLLNMAKVSDNKVSMYTKNSCKANTQFPLEHAGLNVNKENIGLNCATCKATFKFKVALRPAVSNTDISCVTLLVHQLMSPDIKLGLLCAKLQSFTISKDQMQ